MLSHSQGTPTPLPPFVRKKLKSRMTKVKVEQT
jgi:hypothetical protein